MGKKVIKKHDKTDTIKKRALYIYLPSEEMTKDWKEKAKQQNTSISKFIIEHVENSMTKQGESHPYQTRMDLVKENSKLKSENKDLLKRNKILNTAIERLEEELKKQRAQPFIETDYTGIRNYEKDLINLFRQKKEIRKEELIDYLNLDINDTLVIKAVNKQIENLEEYGLIKDLGGKWLWKP